MKMRFAFETIMILICMYLYVWLCFFSWIFLSRSIFCMQMIGTMDFLIRNFYSWTNSVINISIIMFLLIFCCFLAICDLTCSRRLSLGVFMCVCIFLYRNLSNTYLACVKRMAHNRMTGVGKLCLCVYTVYVFNLLIYS